MTAPPIVWALCAVPTSLTTHTDKDWKTGRCSASTLPIVSDCTHGMSGSFALQANETQSWEETRRACVENRCSKCSRCNFVSFSLRRRICSWYHQCPADLFHAPRFRTVQVHGFKLVNGTRHSTFQASKRAICGTHNNATCADHVAGALNRMNLDAERSRNGRISGHLVYHPSDTSADAQAWRADERTKRAVLLLSALPWLGKAKNLIVNPLVSNSVVDVQTLAFGYEVAQGFVGMHKHIRGVGVGKTEGMMFFGVKTEQSVVDASVIQYLLYKTRTDLLIELGTYCGGSAVYYAKMMLDYNPTATVVTVDISDPARNFCYENDAVRKPVWKMLTERQTIISMVGDLSRKTPLKQDQKIRALIERLARNASSVMVIDDSDHLSPPTVRRFDYLSKFVTPGNFYILQDTRLDFDCAYSQLTVRRPWDYCWQILDQGGSWDAAQKIAQNRVDFFQDRSVEFWGTTQHPGGYLRKLRSGELQVRSGGRTGLGPKRQHSAKRRWRAHRSSRAETKGF